MVKQTKNRMPYSTSLNKNLVEKIKALSDKTRIPVAYLIDEAIEDLLKKYQKLILLQTMRNKEGTKDVGSER